MRRSLLSLAALLCASSLLTAQVGPTTTITPSRRDPAKAAVLVVDPNDFRQPIFEPEASVAPKYNDQTVRFTGLVVRSGEDAKEKRRWVELQVTLPEPITTIAPPGPPARLKPGALPPGRTKIQLQTVTVRVYPQFDDPRLRNPTGQLEATAEGRGSVAAGSWTLIISDATVSSVRLATSAPSKDTPIRR